MSFRVKGLQDAHSPTHVRCPGAWEQRGRGVSGGMGVGPGPVLHHGRWKGSHKVLYYRPTKNERITCITLTCLGFFFPCLFTKQQQERKMQEAGEPGPGIQIRREQGGRTKLLLQVGPGLCPSIPGAEPQAPVFQQPRSSVATLEGSRSGALGAPMFGGLVSKAQAHRGQTEEGGGRGQHRRVVSSTGVPPGPRGPGRQGQSGCFPACQPISFFRKASSWSSSLIPTNLSTTSPFFIASTVGTADTWVERTKEVKSLRSELFSTLAPSSGERAAGSGLEVTAQSHRRGPLPLRRGTSGPGGPPAGAAFPL